MVNGFYCLFLEQGLLAAFPKLLSSGSREHTFIDTESVRYVYQPLESFFVLIITNKTSNIVEDLHTIQVLAKLVPDICAPLSEASIRDKQFELVFGFDELITAGATRRTSTSRRSASTWRWRATRRSCTT